MTNELPAQPPSYFPIAQRQGLLLAVVSMILTVLYLSVLGPSGVGTMVLIYGLSIAAYVVFARQAIIMHRDGDLEGFISFQRAFMTGFVTILIACLITVVFQFIYLEWIDPGAMEAQLESQEKMMERFGASEEVIEQAMEEARERAKSPMNTLVGALMGLFCTGVLGAITALILAAILKKERPLT